jgi:hypothetical protein
MKRKPLTLTAPRMLTAEELAARIKRDPAYPHSFVWVVFSNDNVNFADETAEGATALAKQYHQR